MSRAVEEWIGKTDDSVPPASVRLRILRRYSFHCYRSGAEIAPNSKGWALDHIKALCNGGENRESNLAPISFAEHKLKTAEDVAIRKKTDAMTKAAFNIKAAPTQKIKSAGFQPSEKQAARETGKAGKLPLPARVKDVYGRRING